jgi:uncharacterized membrane protein YgdD (TMEM256/DUF423 family)
LFDVRRSTFDVRRSTFEVRRSTFDVRSSTFEVRRSTFDVEKIARTRIEGGDMGQQVFFLRTAAILGALAVGLGAFGAHGLKERLSPEMLTIYEVGVRYHMYHALALLAVALAPQGLWSSAATTTACWAWLVGILIFSGSLYALALTQVRWLGAITPIGGVAFIVGWIALAVAAGKIFVR